MKLAAQIRERLWVIYWSIKLMGYKIDEAKGIIYSTKYWRFVVEDGVFRFRSQRYDKYRLHLHTHPKSGRIVEITIG